MKNDNAMKPITKVSSPPCVTAEVVSKLETCFHFGCTVTEACQVAEISRQTYYQFLKANPDFADRFKALQERPVIAARKRIVEQIPEDTKTAQWYLERKRPEEFSQKALVQHQHRVELSDEELLERIERIHQKIREAGYIIEEEQELLPEPEDEENIED